MDTASTTPAPAPAPMPVVSSYHSSPIELAKISFAGLKLSLKAAILAYLTVAAVYAVGGFVAVLAGRVSPLLTFLIVVVLIAAGISYLLLPLYRLALAAAKHEAVTYKQLFEPNVGLAWRLFGTTLLAGIIIGLGFLLLVVPGFIFLGRYMYVSYVVLNEGLTGMDALHRSSAIAHGRFVEGYGVLGVSIIGEIFELIPVVGIFLTAIYSFFILPLTARRYLELSELKTKSAEEVDATKKSGMNWLIIVVAIIIALTVGSVNQKRQKERLNETPIYNSVVTRSFIR